MYVHFNKYCKFKEKYFLVYVSFISVVDRWFKGHVFEVWAFLGHKVPVGLSISAN